MLGASAPKERPIRIGLVFGFDQQAEAVTQLVEGMELAAADLVAAGTPVVLERVDSGRSASGTQEAMARLASRSDPPDVIIAELDSSRAVVAAEVAEKRQRVMLTPLATSYLVTEGRKYVFRGTFSDRAQGRALANLAIREAKGGRVVVVTDAGEVYSKTLAETFEAEFSRRGEKIASRIEILADQLNPEAIVATLKESRADVVFMPLYATTAARILNAAKRMGFSTPLFLGGDAWGQYPQAFRDIVLAKGSPLRTYWAAHFRGETATAELREFGKRYEAAYHKPLTIAPAAGYDVLVLSAKAVSGAGGAGAQQSAIAKWLRSMKPPFVGLTGSVAYASDTNDNIKPVAILRAKDGDIELVTEVGP
jgi:branched-chain amino acid transport system substrate-binding protein